MNKGKIIQLKIVIFTAVKNCCILNGRDFVMKEKKMCTFSVHAEIISVNLISNLLLLLFVSGHLGEMAFFIYCFT